MSVTADDFDDDGHLDVAVANNLSQDVTVAYGDGQGGFPRRRTILSDAGTRVVTSGRVNDDRLPDIVALNFLERATYTVLTSRGTDGFEAAETFRTVRDPSALAAADCNGDGRPDVAVVSGSEAMVGLLMSVPGGGFSSGVYALEGSATGIALRDVNSDFRPDLLVVVGETVGVSLNSGAGRFGPLDVLDIGRAGAKLAAGDLNADGALDIVVTESQAQSVGVFLGRGDGTFVPVVHRSVRTGDTGDFFPLGLALEDIDRDSHMDIVATNFLDAGASLSILYGAGGATFDAPTSVATLRRPLAVVASDLDLARDDDNGNRDQIRDLVTVNQDSPNGMLIHQATAARTFTAPPPINRRFPMGTVPAALVLRDVDGDGLGDAVVADRVNDQVLIRLGQSTTSLFRASQVRNCPHAGCLATGRTPIDVAVADFDGDGTYDIFTGNAGGDNVTLAVATHASAVLRGDANGDGLRTVADVTQAMKTALAGVVDVTIEEALARDLVSNPGADVDGDGSVTPTDVIGAIGWLFRG
jgi:hypothetical protein